jgi:hypothetical protein
LVPRRLADRLDADRQALPAKAGRHGNGGQAEMVDRPGPVGQIGDEPQCLRLRPAPDLLQLNPDLEPQRRRDLIALLASTTGQGQLECPAGGSR